MAKALVRGGAWRVFTAVAGAALAGIGWKLGVDAYEAVKKRTPPPPPFNPEEEPE